MSGILTILKNNFFRSLARKNYIIIMLLITALSIFLAVYFTSKLEIKGNIAVVSNSGLLKINSKYFEEIDLDRAPPTSELVMNKYDAVVIDKGNGGYEIRTIKK